MSFAGKLNHYFSRQDKLLLGCFSAFSVLVAFLETVSIAFVMPFIGIATNFDLIKNYYYINYYYQAFFNGQPRLLILTLGATLSLIYLVRTILSILFIYGLNKFVQNKYHTISVSLFENYLALDYKDFVTKNSASMHKRIMTDTGHINQILASYLIMSSELFTVFFIYLGLLWVGFFQTIALTAFLLLVVLVGVRPFFKYISYQGSRNSKFVKETLKIFNEAFGNFKLIKIFGNEPQTIKRFSDACYEVTSATTLNITFQSAPRLFLELFGVFSLVAIIMSLVYSFNDTSMIMPFVMTYAVGFYKILPSLNKILSSYNQITFYKKSIDLDDDTLLGRPKNVAENKISFNQKIELKNVSFAYRDNNVLEGVNLVINKGDKIAFVGDSGSGKSTMIDLLTGIYQPTDGSILIDNTLLNKASVRSWNDHVGYVPQETYLFDGTVADNVVFGRPYDENLLTSSLKRANIYSYLKSKDGIGTKVGEGGIMLSGGQKQRISIARAFYSNPDVLILDEATSALDTDTESRIMNEVYENNQDKTLILITHRLSTVKACDVIYKIDNGLVGRVINYQTTEALKSGPNIK